MSKIDLDFNGRVTKIKLSDNLIERAKQEMRAFDRLSHETCIRLISYTKELEAERDRLMVSRDVALRRAEDTLKELDQFHQFGGTNND